MHPYYDQAKAAFLAGVAAADPYAAVSQALPSYDIAPTVIAVGKAAGKMARAARDGLGDVAEMIVVTNPENASEMDGAQCFAAAHPVPDAVGLEAGQAVIAALRRAAKAGRPILCLISGGGSALLPAPRDGISLAEKQAVNAALLGSGADIVEMNMVRQQLSQLKGGGLLRFAGNAPVTALILSDVIGDDLRAIASGPTASPIGTTEMAKTALMDRGVWDALPASVRAALDIPLPPVERTANNVLVGSNAKSGQAAAAMLEGAVFHKTPLIGDVADAAEWVLRLPKGVHVFGGETTVTLRGDGRGGRNQELALRVALGAKAAGWSDPWLYLQAGTDGRDGPTDAAGGVVSDQTQFDRQNAEALLANNDSYAALQAMDGLLITDGTGTNVADLGILIRG